MATAEQRQQRGNVWLRAWLGPVMLRIDSESSTFVPRASIEHMKSAKILPLTHASPKYAPAKVLIVENDSDTASAIEDNLKKEDLHWVDVSRATSLAECVHQLGITRFDVIILDLDLPDGKGVYCIELVRSQNQSTPLVVLTTEADDGCLRRYVASGAQDCLPKESIRKQCLVHFVRYAMLRKSREEERASLHNKDALTGLLNRKIIHDRIDHAMFRHRRSTSKMAVLWIDLVAFSLINSTYGRHHGDKVLQVVADSLRSCVRKEDSVARVGNDEYVVLVENFKTLCDLETVIDKVMSAVTGPCALDGIQLTLEASIGVSIFDGANPSEMRAEVLLERADFSMYRAKQIKGNRYEIFDTHFGARDALGCALESCVTDQKFDKKQFRVTYVPIMAQSSGNLFSAQAVLTWCHKGIDHGVTTDFFPMIEHLNIAKPLGKWFLQQALEEWGTYCCATDADGDRPLLFIRLPSKFLFEGEALNLMDEVLTELKVDRQKVVLELLGADITQHLSLAKELTRILTDQMSMQVCISDFGAHNSALMLLQDIQCHFLRLSDCLFSAKVDRDKSLAIVESLQSLALRLGLQVIAPSGLDAKWRESLMSIGIDLFQDTA